MLVQFGFESESCHECEHELGVSEVGIAQSGLARADRLNEMSA